MDEKNSGKVDGENEIGDAEKEIEESIESTKAEIKKEDASFSREELKVQKQAEELKRLKSELDRLKKEKGQLQRIEHAESKPGVTELEVEVDLGAIKNFLALLYRIFITKRVLFYVILILAVYMGFTIRMASLPALGAVNSTTGAAQLIGNGYLGVGGSLTGLDPYIFYIEMNNIIRTGNVPTVEHLEYLPIGYPTRSDELLISFMGAYMFNFLHPIVPQATSMTWFMIYPAIAGILLTLLLFLLCLEIFGDYNIAALSVLFLPVFQTLLNRTTAGFSTKDALGFVFILLVMYFLAKAIKAKDARTKVIYGVMVGLATGLTAVTSGFAKFVIFLVPIVYIILILLDYAKKEDLYAFLPFALFVPIMASMLTVSTDSFVSGTQYYPMYFCYAMVLVKLFVYDKYKHKLKIPLLNNGTAVGIYALLISAIVLLVIGKLSKVFSYLINELQTPLGIGTVNPVTQTIAEYGQVTFAGRLCEYSGLTGACGAANTIGLNFLLLSAGGIILLYFLLKRFKHWYVPFLLAMPFLILLAGGTYSPGNGATTMLLVFMSGTLIPLIYWVIHRKDAEMKRALSPILVITFVSLVMVIAFFLSNQTTNYYKYGGFGIAVVLILTFAFDRIDERQTNKSLYIIVFVFLFLTILFSNLENQLLEPTDISAAIIVPFVAVAIPAFIIKYARVKLKSSRTAFWAVTILVIIVTISFLAIDLNGSLQSSYAASQASGSGLALWGPTMQWINYNTPINSTLISWWDYGYWEEAIANRTTVADGSNAYNYQTMIAKFFFESTSPYQYATYLNFVHDPTYAVISGSEVEKFSAISTIALNYTQFTPMAEATPQTNPTNIGHDGYKYLAVFGGNGGGIGPVEANMVINGVPVNGSNALLIEVLIPFNYTNNTVYQGVPYGIVYNALTAQQSNPYPLQYSCAYSVGCSPTNANGTVIPGGVMLLNGTNSVALHLGNYPSLPGGFAEAPINTSNYGNAPALLFMPAKSLNTLFTKLYLLNETVPGFTLAFTDNLPVDSLLSINNQVLTNINVYKINYTALQRYMLTGQCSVSTTATDYCDNLSYLPAIFNKSKSLIEATPIN